MCDPKASREAAKALAKEKAAYEELYQAAQIQEQKDNDYRARKARNQAAYRERQKANDVSWLLKENDRKADERALKRLRCLGSDIYQ